MKKMIFIALLIVSYQTIAQSDYELIEPEWGQTVDLIRAELGGRYSKTLVLGPNEHRIGIVCEYSQIVLSEWIFQDGKNIGTNLYKGPLANLVQIEIDEDEDFKTISLHFKDKSVEHVRFGIGYNQDGTTFPTEDNFKEEKILLPFGPEKRLEKIGQALEKLISLNGNESKK